MMAEKKFRKLELAKKYAEEVRGKGGKALVYWTKTKGWRVLTEGSTKKTGTWGALSKKHVARRIKTAKALKRKVTKKR